MYFWLFIFVILFIAVNKAEEKPKLTSMNLIFSIAAFLLIAIGVVVNIKKPKWSTGVALFIICYSFMLTGGTGLLSLGLALDGTFAYFLLPLCFLIVISFVDEPKLDMIRTIGICMFALFLIYIAVSSYASILDVKKEAALGIENGNSYSFDWNGHYIKVNESNFTKEMKPIRNSLAFYFFYILSLVNLILSTIFLKKDAISEN